MIWLDLNEPLYEYDIHSLVKAFYPQEDVAFVLPKGEEAPLMTVRVHYQRDEAASGTTSGSIFFAVKTEEGEEYTESEVDFSDRPETKNRIKRAIYRLLLKQSKRTLPWGTLTGIRPTKLVSGFLAEGLSEEAIRARMKETYLCADEKIQLALAVAKRERQVLTQLVSRICTDEAEQPKKTDGYEAADWKLIDGYSLYIGIPFCPTRCLYCSFTSYPVADYKDRVDAYLTALIKEMRFAGKALSGRRLDTVYIGGGTPTTLSPVQLDRLFTAAADIFDLKHAAEYTVECGRPDTITRQKLAVIRAHGIDRISINPQTMNQKTLDLIGRRHTAEQIRESFYLAREAGFRTINMDLIAGLPKETDADLSRTLEEVLALGPENLTIHALAVKRAARLSTEHAMYAGLSMEYSDDANVMIAKRAAEAGLYPYYLYRQKNMAGNFENVGYAKAGHEGLYNILIMEEKQTIIALGAGAMTKFVMTKEQMENINTAGERPVIRKPIIRVENVKDIDAYLARTDEMIERKRKEMEAFLWL